MLTLLPFKENRVYLSLYTEYLIYDISSYFFLIPKACFIISIVQARKVGGKNVVRSRAEIQTQVSHMASPVFFLRDPVLVLNQAGAVTFMQRQEY